MNNKWWENYLVRYALGFAFALAFSFFILNKFAIYADGKEINVVHQALMGNNNHISMIIIIPLAASICYICAAPIIVLHAGRYRRGLIDRLSRNFWYAWLALGFIFYFFRNQIDVFYNFYLLILFSCFVLIGLLCIILDFSSGKTFTNWFDFIGKTFFVGLFILLLVATFIKLFVYPVSNDLSYVKIQSSWIYLSMPAIWIFIGQYSVLHRMLKNEDGFYEFYEKLSIKRANGNFQDARETYSHLREHSNAFFIVAVEISVFSFVLFLINLFEKKKLPPESYIHIFHVIVFTMLAWILPAIFMWSTANRLESRFFQSKKEL